MSRRSTGNPALAKWAAIREPMVPAPRTATRRSGVIGRQFSAVPGYASPFLISHFKRAYRFPAQSPVNGALFVGERRYRPARIVLRPVWKLTKPGRGRTL